MDRLPPELVEIIAQFGGPLVRCLIASSSRKYYRRFLQAKRPLLHAHFMDVFPDIAEATQIAHGKCIPMPPYTIELSPNPLPLFRQPPYHYDYAGSQRTVSFCNGRYLRVLKRPYMKNVLRIIRYNDLFNYYMDELIELEVPSHWPFQCYELLVDHARYEGQEHRSSPEYRIIIDLEDACAVETILRDFIRILTCRAHREYRIRQYQEPALIELIFPLNV